MNKLQIIGKAVVKYTLGYLREHWREFATGLIGGLAAGTLSGCGGMGQSDHGTRTTVWAIGVPGVAILHDTTVSPVNTDTSDNEAIQVNTIDIDPKFK